MKIECSTWNTKAPGIIFGIINKKNKHYIFVNTWLLGDYNTNTNIITTNQFLFIKSDNRL